MKLTPGTDHPGDRGMANERTALAWQRSTLSLLVIAALAIRTGLEEKQLAIACSLAAVLLAAAVATWLHGRAAYHRRTSSKHPDGAVTHLTLMRGITAATLVAAAGSAALTTLSR